MAPVQVTVYFCSLWLSLCCWLSLIVDVAVASGPSTLIGIVGRDYVLLGADSAYSGGNGGISLTSNEMDKIHAISHTYDKRNPMLAALASNDLAHSQRFLKVLKGNVIMREYQDGLGNDVVYVYNNNNNDDKNNHHDHYVEDLGWNVANMAEFARTQMLPSCSMLLAGFIKKQDVVDTGKQRNSVFSSLASSANGNQIDNSPHQKLQEQIKAAREEYKLTESITAEEKEDEIEQNDCDFIYKPQLYCLDDTQCLVRQCQYSAQGYGSNFILSILDRNYDPNMTLENAIELLNDCYQQLAKRFVLNAPKPPTMKCIYYDKKSQSCLIRSTLSSDHKHNAEMKYNPCDKTSS